MAPRQTDIIKVDDGTDVAQGALLCPCCGEIWLHHSSISEFDKEELAIDFWCEICGLKPTLTFRQHKGVTMLAWLWDDTDTWVTEPGPSAEFEDPEEFADECPF